MSVKQPVLLLSYDHGGYIYWGERFRDCLEEAFAWLDKYPDFKIGLDNEAFAYDAYAEEVPEIIEMISEGLKRYPGRFGIGSCTYGQPLAAFISEESNIRQLTYAIKTNKKYFDITPNVYAVSEHAFHSQIPELIAGTGYQGALMRTHFMMYGYNPTYQASIGKWIGPDGTTVTTVPTYDEEGASFAATTFDNWVLTRWPRMTSVSLDDFCNAFKDIELLLGSRYDDITLRCEELVSHTQDNPKYKWILLEELLGLYPEPKAIFAPKPGEFKTRMPWGYCGNKIWNDCREAERFVALAERANAIAVLMGGEDQSGVIEEAWKKLLISQHHDIQICGLTEEADNYLSKSIEISKTALSASMRFFSEATFDGEVPGVTVFNPLSWNTKEPVSCDVVLPKNSTYNGFSLVCGDEKVPCDVQILDYDKKGIRRGRIYFTIDVPALAVKRYELRNAEPLSSEIQYTDGVLRSPYYEIELNKNGIMSITDAKTSKKYVSSEEGTLFSGVINGICELCCGRWNAYIKSHMAEVVYLGTIGSVGIIFTMRVYSDCPRIDCKVTFHHHGERIGRTYDDKDADTDIATKDPFYALASPKDNLNGFIHDDKLCFELRLPFGRTALKTHDLPFMVTDTDEDVIQGNYWVSISDGETGLAFFNRGAMGALYRDGVFKVPLAYANDYVWGSRLLYGDYEHEFAILPFNGTPNEADIHRKALAYQYPFVSYFDNGNSKISLPRVIQPISFECDRNVALSALYVENGGILVRMYEFNGQAALIQSSCDLYETNLLGDNTGSNLVRCVHLDPYRIGTFSVCFKK